MNEDVIRYYRAERDRWRNLAKVGAFIAVTGWLTAFVTAITLTIWGMR